MTQLHYKNITLEKILENNDQPRKTKIICTIGPACDNVEMLVNMIDAGLSIARLNFSHGDHESKRKTIQNLREAMSQRPDSLVSILLDTKGPEIRTGFLEDSSGMFLNRGDHVEIVTDYEFKGRDKIIACSYEKLPLSVKIDDMILAADGSLVMKVVEILATSVIVEMQNSGKLGERKNMNLPGNKVDLPTITEKDVNDLKTFAKDIDFVAASFVQKGSDIDLVRNALGVQGSGVKVIAKIENQEGLHNFDEILSSFDGVMVARGDMGMEIPIEKVFLAQKMLIRKCNLMGKPVVTATQMLESMTQNPRPTRAESTDVANAVLDGTDCVMLSGETAGGGYPLESVNMIAAICREAESAINHRKLFSALENSIKAELFRAEPVETSNASVNSKTSTESLVSKSKTGRTKLKISESLIAGAVKMQVESDSRMIVVIGDNGSATMAIAKYRPSCIVLFISDDVKTARQLTGLWSSVFGIIVPKSKSFDDKLAAAQEFAKSRKWVQSGDNMVILSKSPNSSRFSVKTGEI